jgi:hypothetical protein
MVRASCWIYIGTLLGAHPILHINRIRVNLILLGETGSVGDLNQPSGCGVGTIWVSPLWANKTRRGKKKAQNVINISLQKQLL